MFLTKLPFLKACVPSFSCCAGCGGRLKLSLCLWPSLAVPEGSVQRLNFKAKCTSGRVAVFFY